MSLPKDISGVWGLCGIVELAQPGYSGFGQKPK